METRKVQALVVGSGAAGYAALCRLLQAGVKAEMVTEGIRCGTSRNTGSDKQTYYKLSLGGGVPDSVRSMAEDLFSAGAVDGDSALCEAALSAGCFLTLCQRGVPFPKNEYGEYVGYQTDHDEKARATSAGPLTSKYMTEALEAWARELGAQVRSGLYAMEILTGEQGVCGLLCAEADGTLHAFETPFVVWAAGGPAGVYEDSVYPLGHAGTSSPVFLAGAKAQNLSFWQYGLASVSPRWNVSGSYMQVLPRLVSVDSEGVEREFLLDEYKEPYEALSKLFLKGYQWPFDSERTQNGSSRIDMLVYEQRIKLGRKVFLDYRTNPFGIQQIDFSRLDDEARRYLEKTGALQQTPIERLEFMNAPAAALYQSRGVNLKEEMLEIALCAQHHNGGIAVDACWQTCVQGLYAVGECAGTHGVKRPGGSALNAGQAGALRAAEHIAQCEERQTEGFQEALEKAIERAERLKAQTGEGEAQARLNLARRRMSEYGGPVRNVQGMVRALEETNGDMARFGEYRGSLWTLLRLKDALFMQKACLSSMADMAKRDNLSRGGALYEGAEPVKRGENLIQQGAWEGENWVFTLREPRNLPPLEESFETMWKKDRQRRAREKKA